MPITVESLREQAKVLEQNMVAHANMAQQISGALAVVKQQIDLLISEQPKEDENGETECQEQK